MENFAELPLEKQSAKKKRRRRGRTIKLKNEFGSRNKLAEQLRARYGRKYENDEVAVAHIDLNTNRVVQPSSYQRQMAKATDAHVKRLLQPEPPENLISGGYCCALCQHGTCYAELGELFGPYNVLVDEFGDMVPPKCVLTPAQMFAKKQGTSGATNLLAVEEDNSAYTDLWFHGDCALWAPNLILADGQFPFLGTAVANYWKQKCKICNKIGATIAVQGTKSKRNANPDLLHYPCAIEKNYHLNAFLSRCESPDKKFAGRSY